MGLVESFFGKLSKKKRGRIEKIYEINLQEDLSAAYSVKGDLLVVGTKGGKIACIKDRKIVFWFDTRERMDDTISMFLDMESSFGVYTQPIIDDKLGIIFGNAYGTVFAVNAKGKLRWKFQANGSIKSNIVVEDIDDDGKKEILFGAGDSKVYVLNAKGKLLWEFEASSPIESTPAVLKEKGLIFFGTNDGELYCINNKGEQKWVFRTEGKIAAEPVIDNIYNDKRYFAVVGSEDKKLYVISMNGALEWSFKSEGKIVARATIEDIDNDGKKEILIGSTDDKVYAISAHGSKIWEYETGFWVVVPPIVYDIDDDTKKEVLVASYDKNLYILDPKGSYLLNYMPGISGISHQPGHVDDIMNSEPGSYYGNVLWKYRCKGMVIGVSLINKNNIITLSDNGYLEVFSYKKESDKE